MKQPLRYWLAFDLGLRGNYEELYGWLDALEAKECGENLATFRSTKTREQISQELSSILGSDRNVRAYLISMRQGGKFILGKRKASPWMGYSQQAVEAEEEK
jgi:hypothetical protein